MPSSTNPSTRAQLDKTTGEELVGTTTKEPVSKRPSWPSYVPLVQSFQKNSLLEGTEPLVWRALGNVDDIENYSKQLAIRQALEELKLAWVATNTTPFRVVVGKLYDHALAAQRENENELSQQPDPKMPKITLPKLEIITKTIPDNPGVQGPLLDQDGTAAKSFDKAQRGSVWRDIDKYGACVIRNALGKEDIAKLLKNEIADADRSDEPASSKVTETQGSGVPGVPTSHYEDWPTPYSDSLVELEKSIIDLLQDDGLPREIQQRKHIVLKFGAGGENWAHRDDHHDESFPIQAELLLSEPTQEFNGGQFYIAKRDDDDTGDTKILRIRRNMVEWENAGDLVIFHGNYSSSWWHGMEKVELGEKRTNVTYPKKSLGMLQPI